MTLRPPDAESPPAGPAGGDSAIGVAGRRAVPHASSVRVAVGSGDPRLLRAVDTGCRRAAAPRGGGAAARGAAGVPRRALLHREHRLEDRLLASRGGVEKLHRRVRRRRAGSALRGRGRLRRDGRSAPLARCRCSAQYRPGSPGSPRSPARRTPPARRAPPPPAGAPARCCMRATRSPGAGASARCASAGAGRASRRATRATFFNRIVVRLPSEWFLRPRAARVRPRLHAAASTPSLPPSEPERRRRRGRS